MRRLLGVCLVAWAGWLAQPAWAQAGEAVIVDKAESTGRSTGTFYVLEAVDGKALEGSAYLATARASRGRGPDMRIAPFERPIPAGRSTLTVRLSTLHVMPIVALFSSSERLSLQGQLQVDLQAGVRYRLNGVQDHFRREIWLEEEASQKRLGDKLVFKFEPEGGAKAMEGAQFTCCNLHYDGDWISDANWATAPMIPAGARIKVLEVKSDRAHVLIEGRPFRIGQEYGQKLEKIQALLAKLLVSQDPRPIADAYPAAVKAALAQGKLRLGLSKPQVLMSMGPPRVDLTPSMDASAWTYFSFDEEPLQVRFGPDGLVDGFEGGDKVKALLVLTE